MANATVTLRLEAGTAACDLGLLAEAAERFPKLAKRLLEAGDFAFELTRIDGESSAAVPTGHVVLRLDLPDVLTELAAAVRAGEFDAM